MSRILLIDDDPAILDLEKKILSDAGFDVLVTEDALSALDVLELYKVDLIIVDVEMPRLNGFQFVTTIRNNPALEHISLAFLSAHSESEAIEKAGKLGADFYLLKPIEHKTYLDKINSFLKKKAVHEHPRIIFNPPSVIEIKAHLFVQVSEFSDIGIKIITNQNITEGQILELPSKEFQGLFSENPLLRVLWVKSEKGGLKKAALFFTNNSLDTVRKIQRYIHAKNTPAELLKYPKWR